MTMMKYDDLRRKALAATQAVGDPTTPSDQVQQVHEDLKKQFLAKADVGAGRVSTEPIGAETLPLPRVSRGRIVHTHGPWSNGHEEQAAIVTHVYGDGVAPGTMVNLHVFIDLDQSIPVGEVPWYATRAAAMAAIALNEYPTAHLPNVCWFPDRD